MTGLHQVLPGWVDRQRARGHTATYDLRLRGLARYTYRFHDGALRIDETRRPGHVDVHISSDPVTALLLNYGRISTVRASLSGRTVAWGRRPWLGATLPGRFHPA